MRAASIVVRDFMLILMSFTRRNDQFVRIQRSQRAQVVGELVQLILYVGHFGRVKSTTVV